jgi:hypothetical protein
MADPKQRAAAFAVSLALLTTGEHAVAQTAPELEARLSAGALTSRQGALPISGLALTPGIRYADRRVTFAANGSAWLADQWQLGNASAAFTAQMPLLYGFHSEVVANADRQFFGPSMSSEQLDASGRIHYMRQRGGIWLGSGVARPLRAATVSNVNVSSGGAWTKLGKTTLRGSVTSFFFTKVAVDSQVESQQAARTASACAPTALEAPTPPVGSGDIAFMTSSNSGCRHQSRVTDLESSVRYEHRLVEITARGGRRFGTSFDVTPESKQWASAQVAVWLSSQLAATAGGGSEPAQPTRGLPARKFGSLGVMLAYWPIPRGAVPVVTPASLVQVFELRPAGPDMQRVSARIGSVETVEVMGDFSGWEPVPMIRRGRDQWELLVRMGSGVHQINMRIDGGKWIAPPGMPKMKDDFNGEVGLHVIKK